MLVYEDKQNPANSIECFLGISGCIGDVPFTTTIANSCGHTCMKPCKFCFEVGCTRNAAGHPLNTVRLGGYDPAVKISKAHKVVGDGGWSVVDAQFSKPDGSFDSDKATEIRVTPEQHAMRVQSAIDVREEARQAHPAPVRPNTAVGGNQEQLDWQAGPATSCCIHDGF